MASTLRIASRVLPRATGSLCRTSLPARSLTAQIGHRRFSQTAGRFEVIKRFTEDHEWISIDTETKIGTIGITEYAQKSLGDVVYVELPTIGDEISQGDSIGSVESVKSASDIMTPISGTVVETNTALDEKPALINKGAEGEEGWIAKIEVAEIYEEQLGELMDQDAYEKHTKGEEEEH